jgi:LysR family transcriptional activator of nhaA
MNGLDYQHLLHFWMVAREGGLVPAGERLRPSHPTLDVVIADTPVPPSSSMRGHGHQLGSCGVGLFAVAKLAAAHRATFPRSLDGAPFLLPAESLGPRRALDAWFDRHGIRPHVVAESEDSALMKVCGADGVGIFPAHEAVRRDVEGRYGVVRLGVVEGVVERFYAISVDRRLKHPAVLAISRAAHEEVLAP